MMGQVVDFPTQAQIVVIGGGVIGTSIAYHLLRAGARDVLLLEKARLTEGATWHAAGLVGQFRSQQNLMRLMADSVALFDTLEAETGLNPGWRKVGSLRLAASADRWLELKRAHSAAQAVGFDMQMLGPGEARDLFPLIEIGDLHGAAFIASDGHIDPSSLTQAYARGIRHRGGRIIERVMVTGLRRKGARISHVITDQGEIATQTVVNAAGLWARQLGWMAGVDIPAGVVEHQYLVTEKTDDMPRDLPALRDPDGSFYVKPEPGALAIGGWERATRPVSPADGFPWSAERHLFDPDMDRLEEFLTPAMARLPILERLGIRTVINGPIPISPDGEPIMGLVPGLDNFFAACGFTSGIAASGGAGKAMANWIIQGDPGLDLWAFDIRRFGALHGGAGFLHQRAVESYARYYRIHWPGEEMASARGLRRSPLYQTLADQGAVFGSKFGWERANWFAQGDAARVQKGSFDRRAQTETVGREHRAAREGVVLADMTSFTKFEITGRDAARFLQYLAVSNVDRPPGAACYTQLCNQRGGIEADVTIIRRATDRFWLITGSALGVRDGGWISQHMRDFQRQGADLHLRDITSGCGVIHIAGPKSRAVLARICDADLGEAAFPFMSALDVRIGHAPALAYRISFTGELGWELYIPTEYMGYVYELLQDAGADHAIANIGYHAIDSLRMEKRFLVWGADISPDYNPLEAGLQFLIDWDKGEFVGRAALAKVRAQGVTRRMCCLALDDALPVFGGEAILAGGKVIGQTTSGNFGHTVGKSLVLGYLSVGAWQRDDLAVNAFGEISGARLFMGL
jgi:glycine cleavage system aminomethyltransferase T/glycine/D-amino acid oxidase-like deaminating enzyme